LRAEAGISGEVRTPHASALPQLLQKREPARLSDAQSEQRIEVLTRQMILNHLAATKTQYHQTKARLRHWHNVLR
jgi:hypothetical protein